ncbi:hypothetical protein [Nonomuraea sp. NPDC052265]|uniref:hypothetical protein n=1 Tax=Nonomuraea sp. NPDC052265 TaxID=3364374 RepID=UPI0037C4F180
MAGSACGAAGRRSSLGRQRLATAHTTHDAAERRVTELYAKAAEQFRNARALERLARDTRRCGGRPRT